MITNQTDGPTLVNTGAEQALLGSLLIKPSLIEHVPRTFEAGQLVDPWHAEVFQSIRELGIGANAMTVAHAVALGDKEKTDYVSKLPAAMVGLSRSDVQSHCRVITDLWQRRSLVEIAEQINAGAHDAKGLLTAKTTVTEAQARLEQIISADEREVAGPNPAVAEYLSVGAWMKREIPPADWLLGDLLTTTSRMFIVGKTGLGKTMLGMSLAVAIASGTGFLHWRSSRPARVLYVDGEMPSELIKARAHDAMRRAATDIPPQNLHIFARDSEEQFAAAFPSLGTPSPLNTQEGQHFIKTLIAALGGVDLVIFDNVMSLVSGDQKDEIPWTETLPLVSALTRQCIGQIWLDHTGHNTDRQYGTSTKAWRFDAVGIMTGLPEDQLERGELGFTLSFDSPGKARRRTPDNWQDFEARTIRLKDDRWTSDAADGGTKGRRGTSKLAPTAQQFYAALQDAFAVSSTPGKTTRAMWFAEAVRVGLAEACTPDEDYKTKDRKQARFRKYMAEIKTAGLIGINNEEITDLSKR